LTMGYPGQRSHPEVVAAMDRAFEAGRAAGITVGGVGGDAAANTALIRQGYGFLLNNGAGFFASACRAFLGGIER
jgi:2-keto-3-deoxy-L-rhamnonate aldolase RhmA